MKEEAIVSVPYGETVKLKGMELLKDMELSAFQIHPLSKKYCGPYHAAQGLIKKGDALCGEKNYEEAIRWYVQAIQKTPFSEFLPVQIVRRRMSLPLDDIVAKTLYSGAIAKASNLDFENAAKNLEELLRTNETKQLIASNEPCAISVHLALAHCYLFSPWFVQACQEKDGHQHPYMGKGPIQHNFGAVKNYNDVLNLTRNKEQYRKTHLEALLLDGWSWLEGKQRSKMCICQRCYPLPQKLEPYSQEIEDDPFLSHLSLVVQMRWHAHQKEEKKTVENIREEADALQQAVENYQPDHKEFISDMLSFLYEGKPWTEKALAYLKFCEETIGTPEKMAVLSCLGEFYRLKGDSNFALRLFTIMENQQYVYGPALFNSLLVYDFKLLARKRLREIKENLTYHSLAEVQHFTGGKSGSLQKRVRCQDGEYKYFTKPCEFEEELLNRILHTFILPKELKEYESVVEFPSLVLNDDGSMTESIPNSRTEFAHHLDELLPNLIRITKKIHLVLGNYLEKQHILSKRQENKILQLRFRPWEYLTQKDMEEKHEQEEYLRNQGNPDLVRAIEEEVDMGFLARKEAGKWDNFHEVWIKDIKPANWGYNPLTKKLIIFDWDYVRKRFPQWDWAKFLDNEIELEQGHRRFARQQKEKILTQFVDEYFPQCSEAARELYFYCAFKKNFYSWLFFQKKEADPDRAGYRFACMVEALQELKERGWRIKETETKLHRLSP